MKKFSKLLLILLTLVCFTNVKAEKLTEDSADATLKDVVINSEKVVCTDYVCEKIIENNDINKVVITYKTNDENASVSEEQLEKMSGLFKNGYGYIPKSVMRCKDLSIQAKAIYSYLISFAGRKN